MIKTALEESFFDVWVEGEISNYHHHTSGHRYFSLKDEKAVIKCAMWRPQGELLKFTPEDGQLVLLHGNISVYEKRGDYQLICRQLVPVGIGPLELAYRQLFEKLSAEGLFGAEHKLPIPEFATRIGVVTSPTGAAIQDFIQISRRRNPAVEIVIYPAVVQGKGAEDTIAAGIEYFNHANNVDIIIIGRGGGSLEDLWAFNTEKVVRAVLASQLPLISAVGHEIDITLSDLVADMRAPTPSAAAELAVWSKTEFQSQVLGQIVRQATLLEKQARLAKETLESILARPVFTRPLDKIYERQQAIDSYFRLLLSAGKNIFDNYKNRLSLNLSRLEALSPLAVLARGYSVSRLLPAGNLLKSVAVLRPGHKIESTFADGLAISTVEEIKKVKSRGRKKTV
jgi:exodeoxyribonuclease VII large subunit